MSFFSKRLVAHLDSIGWGEYGLNKKFETLPKVHRLSEQYVYSLCRGEKNPKVETLEKIAGVPELGLSLERLKGWRAVDVYGPEAILEAAKEIDLERYQRLEPKIKDKARKKAGKEMPEK